MLAAALAGAWFGLRPADPQIPTAALNAPPKPPSELHAAVPAGGPSLPSAVADPPAEPEAEPDPPADGEAEPTAAGSGLPPVLVTRAVDRETLVETEPRQPGETFRDCTTCPEMIVIPAGSFVMGSPPGDDGFYKDERPQREVTIDRPFAVGVHEVTFAEWDACVAAGACNGYRPNDEEWGRGTRPVINVSWHDAQAYVNWLSDHTGHPYRLLSEAEWEYATRAGTTTRYWFGDQILAGNANFNMGVMRTTDVASYAPNPWGLYNVHGNVWEWVQDCWHPSYAGAPVDGSARETPDCDRRVLRGGSWLVDGRNVRAAIRNRDVAADRDFLTGFRVARDL